MFGALPPLRLFPALETAGSLLFLAVGVAFLVSWLVNRGMGSLYLGAIITALAAPELLVAAGVTRGARPRDAVPGRRVPVHRAAYGRASAGARAGRRPSGAILALIGASFAVPAVNELVWPITWASAGSCLGLPRRSGPPGAPLGGAPRPRLPDQPAPAATLALASRRSSLAALAPLSGSGVRSKRKGRRPVAHLRAAEATQRGLEPASGASAQAAHVRADSRLAPRHGASRGAPRQREVKRLPQAVDDPLELGVGDDERRAERRRRRPRRRRCRCPSRAGALAAGEADDAR